MKLFRTVLFSVVSLLSISSYSQDQNPANPSQPADPWPNLISRVLLDPRFSANDKFTELQSIMEKSGGQYFNGTFSPSFDETWKIPYLHSATDLSLQTLLLTGEADTRVLRLFLENGANVQAVDNYFENSALNLVVHQSNSRTYQMEPVQAGINKIAQLLIEFGAYPQPKLQDTESAQPAAQPVAQTEAQKNDPNAELRRPLEQMMKETTDKGYRAALETRIDKLSTVLQTTQSEGQKKNLEAAIEAAKKELENLPASTLPAKTAETNPETPVKKVETAPQFVNLLTIGALRDDILSYLGGLVDGNSRKSDVRKLEIDKSTGLVRGEVMLKTYHVINTFGRKTTVYGDEKENVVNFEFNVNVPTGEQRKIQVDKYPDITLNIGEIQKLVAKHKDTIKY